MFGKKKDKTPEGAAAESKAATEAKSKVKEPKPAKAPKAAKEPKPAKAPKAAKEPKPAKAPKAPKELKAKKEPKPKPKKKVNVTGKSGPGFFAAHVEKVVLGVAAAAVAYFLYSGFTAEGFPTNKTPEGLQADSGSLLNKIRNDDHWAEIAEQPDRDLKPTEFLVRAVDGRKPTDETPFKFGTDIPWNPQPESGYAKRGDPKILPAEDLVVKNVHGALAVEVAKDTVDPFDTMDPAEPIEVRKRREPRNPRGGGYGGEGGMGMGDMGMGGPPARGGEAGGDDDKKPIRKLSAGYDLGVQVAVTPTGGVGRTSGAGNNTGRPLGANRDAGPKTKVMSRGVMFNAITALVPHKKMADDYDAKFENTGSFDPRRDIPVYLGFELQRVDVSGDPSRNIADAEWKTISDWNDQAQLIKKQKWAVFPPLGRFIPEVIDQNSWSYGLTIPIPPLLLHDYREFSKHPAIAWSWNAKNLLPVPPKNDSGKQGDSGDEGGPILPGGPGGLAGGMGGMMGGGMMGGMDGGMGGGMMGDSGYGGDMMGGMGDGDGGMGEMGGMGGMGGMGMGGMGGMGGYGSPAGAKTPQPEFKMVRCFDMLNIMNAAEFGKVYRYRVRLKMRDPNYPDDPRIPQPAPNELEDSVWTRVAPIQSKDDAILERDKDGKATRTQLLTEWSQPSPPVMVQAPFEILASTVEFDSPRKFMQGGKTVTVSTKEVEGNVMVTQLDRVNGSTYVFEDLVRRGTVVGKKFDAEIIVPTSKEIKLKKGHEMMAGIAIADIRGGYKLAGDSRDDPLVAGGEFMLLNMFDGATGRVEVANELDDMFLFRMYNFIDEKESPPPATGGMGGMGDMGGMGGLDGF